MRSSAVWIGVAGALLAPGPVTAERDVDGLEELIPHHESELEVLRFRGRPPASAFRQQTAPPTGPVRSCAEWEPVTGVLVRYPLGLPYELLVDLQEIVTLHVVVSAGNEGSARLNMGAAGVDTASVDWLVRPNDSVWIRDYGPWFAFDGGGDLVIVDHVYNRPYRPWDDLIPVEFGAHAGIPVHAHDMWHTGGNYMTDGAGIALSTALVYDEAAQWNGMSSADVDQLMSSYYGISSHGVVADIENGGIHHIDTWGKLMDEETILLKRVWTWHHTWDDLEQMATLLASLPASTGRPFRVFRVDCHDIGGGEPASYTNSIIVNDRICMPAFGSPAQDSSAASVYRAAAPGYDVRAYAYGGWLTDDALHCRTKGVMDAQMLRVEHVPVISPREGPVTIRARVDDRSGQGVDRVDLVWRFAGGTWATEPMGPLGGDDFQAVIPEPQAATTADYYVLASDLTARVEGMPRVAPAAWYTFPIAPHAATGVPEIARDPDANAYPNPFRESVRFSFSLRFPGQVRLDVIDVRGRLVRRIFDGPLGAGGHELGWDGRDSAGHSAVSGVYRFLLHAAGLVYTRPVVLSR